MAVIPLPRTGIAKGIIALSQHQVQLSKCQQPNCSFHTNKNLGMAETVSTESATTHVRPFHEIPGPKPLPIIGNLWRFFPYIGEYHGMEMLDFQKALNAKYGDIVRLGGFPGRKEMVFIYRPEEVEITFRNEGPWPIREGMSSMEHYRKVTRKDYYGDSGGVSIEHGEKWMAARSKLNQPMLQPRVSKQYIKPIAGVAQDFVDRIKKLRNAKLEMPDDFINELFKWSLESIAYVALDKRIGCLAPNLSAGSEPQKMIDAIGDFFESLFYLEFGPPVWKLYPTASWKKYVNALDFYIEVSMKYVEEAVRHAQVQKEKGLDNSEPSLLERLLDRLDKRSAAILAQDLIIGGVDSTAYSVATAMYFISKNQDKQELLFQELKRLLPNKYDEITEEKLENMKYLKACIKESFRCSPVIAGNMRTSVKDIVLCNYNIPKGVWVVMPNIKTIASDDYFPKANKFIPERWLKRRPTKETAGSAEDYDAVYQAKKNPFAFLPFGFGPRSCLGRRFAELEINILLAKMVRNFYIEYNYGEINFEAKILTTPKEPLRFKILERVS